MRSSSNFSAKKIAVLLTVLIVLAGIFWQYRFNSGSGTSADSPSAEQNAAEPADGTQNNRQPSVSSKPGIPAEKADIVMIGSELEGMYLARAAADERLRVKVLDPREQAGGQLLQGEMLFLDETRDDQYHSLVQGRIKELFDGFKSGKIRKLGEFTTYYNTLSKDISLESGIRIEEIEASPAANEEKKVTSLTYRTKDGKLKKIAAGYFVENSDYAAMVDRLEATRMPGLEKFYGQERIEYMSAGMMMKFKNVDWNKFSKHFNSLSPEEKSKHYGGGYVSESFAIGLSGMSKAYKASNDRVFLRGLNALNQRDGEAIINALLIYNVDPSDAKSVAEAMELGKKEIPRIRDHFRKSIVGWENAEINGYPNYLYIREYNHYETDYVLKPSDLLGAKMFWDNVSIGGYPLDLQGIQANKWGIEMGRPDKYGMPLRSFLLKNYANVILAGKTVGASAIAYGSARIQPNTATAAESIGVILGQIHGKKQLKELTEDDMKPLRDYLHKRYHIKLAGVSGNNKIAGWSADEIKKLDAGEIIYPSYVKTRKRK